MKTIKEIMEKWKREAGIASWVETIAIHCSEHTLFIVTQRPGLFIGYHGQLIEKYHSILKENGYDVTIQFVDIFCGDIKEF